LALKSDYVGKTVPVAKSLTISFGNTLVRYEKSLIRFVPVIFLSNHLFFSGGLINMQLVGLGDKFALWPVNKSTSGQLLTSFEAASRDRKISSRRVDQIVTNTADHLPFQKAGLQDSFTVTCISDKDIDAAQHYFNALKLGLDQEALFEILASAPIFEHYTIDPLTLTTG